MLLLNIDEAFTTAYPEQEDIILGVDRLDIVHELEDRGFYKDADSYLDCHNFFYLMSCPDCGFSYPLPIRCHNRLCPTCGKHRINQVINRFQDFIPKLMENPEAKNHKLRRFEVGFPRIPADEYSSDVYHEIRRCFNRMWNLKDFRSKFTPGIGGLGYAIETKFSKKGDLYFRKNGQFYIVPEDGFNIHIHGFAFCDYIDQKNRHEFSNLWSRATDGRATYGYIDLARRLGGAIGETIKYMFKPPSLHTPSNYGDYYENTRGIRLFATKGSFRKVSISKKNNKEDRGHYGCFFDKSRLQMDRSTISRSKAQKIAVSQKTPMRFLDRFFQNDRLIQPVIIYNN